MKALMILACAWVLWSEAWYPSRDARDFTVISASESLIACESRLRQHIPADQQGPTWGFHEGVGRIFSAGDERLKIPWSITTLRCLPAGTDPRR